MAAARSFVVDASVALSWCFEDEASPLSDAVLDRLANEAALAPGIWPLEVANGLRSAERRGRIDERWIPSATQLLMSLPIHIDETVTLGAALGQVLHTARSVGVSVYDAAYLDLAARYGLPLATADEQLARAARAAGVELIEKT